MRPSARRCRRVTKAALAAVVRRPHSGRASVSCDKVSTCLVPCVVCPLRRTCCLDQVYPVICHGDGFLRIELAYKLAVLDREVLRSPCGEQGHVSRMDGSPLTCAAYGDTVGAGSCELVQSGSCLKEFVCRCGNFKPFVCKYVLVVSQSHFSPSTTAGMKSSKS